jgi:hypothetical protein
MLQDRYGLALSTSSEAAAAAYRDGIDLMLAAWLGAEEALDAAIAADPGFALAHAARARMHSATRQHRHVARAIATDRHHAGRHAPSRNCG